MVKAFPACCKTFLFKTSKPEKETIRIASFDLDAFSDNKLNDQVTAQNLVSILKQFDVIAIQGISSPDHDALPRLIDYLQQVNSSYDYVIGPRSSHTAIHHQFAFIYDSDFVKLDRQQVYSVQDPDDVVSHDPLVGWFSTTARERRIYFFAGQHQSRLDES